MSDEAPPPRRNLWAEASLFLAVLPIAARIAAGYDMSLNSPEARLLLAISPFLAVFSGWIGRRRSRNGPRESRIVANFGFGLGLLGFGCCVIDPAHGVDSARAGRRSQSLNNLRQIALALHQYHAVYDRFPPAVIRDPQGRPLYSWRVAILPFVESQDLYKEFHLDEPWDSPANAKLLERMPWGFQSPGAASRSETPYQAIVGPGTAFESPSGATVGPKSKELHDGSTKFGDFSDGTDRTLMLVAARQSVPWTKPIDVAILPGLPIPALGEESLASRRLFSSTRRVEGFVAAFVDGSVRYFPLSTPESTLRALFSRNGGEAISLEDE